MKSLPKSNETESRFKKLFSTPPEFKRFNVFRAKTTYLPASKNNFMENPTCRFLEFSDMNETNLVLDVEMIKS